MTDRQFTPLEHAVLKAVCEGNPSDRTALDAQLSSAIVHKRENTGAGFFTYFEVKRDPGGCISGEPRRSGPDANIEGLQRGMGFILWLNEGYASCLEGFSYEESTTAIDYNTVSFELKRG